MVVGYTLFRMTKRAPPRPEGRETFQGLPLPKTVTPESAVLDPRADMPAPAPAPVSEPAEDAPAD